MSGGDFSGFTADFGAPFQIERPFEQQAPIPVEADGVDRVLDRVHRAYHEENCSEREALLRGLEVLREEMTPFIRGPGGKRGPSQKAKRRVIGALDHFIAHGRVR